MEGWAVFGMICAALIALVVIVEVVLNIPDLRRYLKIRSM